MPQSGKAERCACVVPHNVGMALLENRGGDAIGLARAQHGCLLPVSTTDEFRRARAKLAANTRHHPGTTEDAKRALDAASRERKLREVLGPPPEGATWLDEIRKVVDGAPPLTGEQRITLAMLVGSAGTRTGATEAGR